MFSEFVVSKSRVLRSFFLLRLVFNNTPGTRFESKGNWEIAYLKFQTSRICEEHQSKDRIETALSKFKLQIIHVIKYLSCGVLNVGHFPSMLKFTSRNLPFSMLFATEKHHSFFNFGVPSLGAVTKHKYLTRNLF